LGDQSCASNRQLTKFFRFGAYGGKCFGGNSHQGTEPEIKLQEQPFRILTLLLENPGQLVDPKRRFAESSGPARYLRRIRRRPEHVGSQAAFRPERLCRQSTFFWKRFPGRGVSLWWAPVTACGSGVLRLPAFPPSTVNPASEDRVGQIEASKNFFPHSSSLLDSGCAYYFGWVGGSRVYISVRYARPLRLEAVVAWSPFTVHCSAFPSR